MMKLGPPEFYFILLLGPVSIIQFKISKCSRAQFSLFDPCKYGQNEVRNFLSLLTS